MKTFLKISVMGMALLFATVGFANRGGKNGMPEYLYIAHADQASVVAQTDKTYRIVLKKAMMSYFTDRPYREAGKLAVAAFVKRWSVGKNNFASDHPNAAMVAVGTQKAPINKFVTLSAPEYDSQTDTLSFMLSPIDKSDSLTAADYSDVALFIDKRQCRGVVSMGCLG